MRVSGYYIHRGEDDNHFPGMVRFLTALTAATREEAQEIFNRSEESEDVLSWFPCPQGRAAFPVTSTARPVTIDIEVGE